MSATIEKDLREMFKNWTAAKQDEMADEFTEMAARLHENATRVRLSLSSCHVPAPLALPAHGDPCHVWN